ncbi:helix-turn-helix domain-containing protein [Actinophytocola algeriensis]|jgi:AraC-like DNA-binding protein|uniref:AraC-like DNA-binding protein n=1 Tax=Actinophytocola algeriensis TaxID=1768010 RepID=A0A7W7Q983_9PSEU|nr:AraC family transcriptional regulator [Actinophytocola algeriensis]MBB4909339.1 AraC-like DNA-binding protein [Actinophytocola algeriensis]MBE1475329.1 AraC-like DNA-binding protein [Actinophytocola algeriensis]
MDELILKAVERVIRAMQNNLGEPITIDDMARTAMFSKFHFSRMFQRVTGISPGRFLSALRLQEAKRLLLTSSLTVADISHLVGYNSIGTFSSRFRMSVGISPTSYRQFEGYVPPLAEHQSPGWHRHGDGTEVRGQVHQQLSASPVAPGHVVVGVFGDRIAQGMPVRHATLSSPGEFVLPGVPDGTWYLLAQSVAVGTDEHTGRDEVYVAALGPLTVSAGMPAQPVDLWLRPRRIFDPPALLAQLDESMWTARARVPGGAEEAALPGA